MKRRFGAKLTFDQLETRAMLSASGVSGSQSTVIEEVTTSADSGAGSLRDAIVEAAQVTSPGAVTVNIEPGLTIGLQSPLDVPPAINPINIVGDGTKIVQPQDGAALVVEEQQTTLFYESPGGTIVPTTSVVPRQPVTISGVTFNGVSQPSSTPFAVIVSQEATDTSLTGCSLVGPGNGVSITNSTAIQNGSTAEMNLSGISITGFDVGVDNDGGLLNIAAEDNLISHNSETGVINDGSAQISELYAYADGGAIGHTTGGAAIQNDGTLSVQNSELVGNDAPADSGAGINSTGGTVLLGSGTSITESLDSPAVQAVNTALTIIGANISGNTNGAILVRGGTTDIEKAQINGNQALNTPIISLYSSPATIDNTEIMGNVADVSPIVSNGSLSGSNNTISGNSTNQGLLPFGFLDSDTTVPPTVITPTGTLPASQPTLQPVTPVSDNQPAEDVFTPTPVIIPIIGKPVSIRLQKQLHRGQPEHKQLIFRLQQTKRDLRKAGSSVLVTIPPSESFSVFIRSHTETDGYAISPGVQVIFQIGVNYAPKLEAQVRKI